MELKFPIFEYGDPTGAQNPQATRINGKLVVTENSPNVTLTIGDKGVKDYREVTLVLGVQPAWMNPNQSICCIITGENTLTDVAPYPTDNVGGRLSDKCSLLPVKQQDLNDMAINLLLFPYSPEQEVCVTTSDKNIVLV